MPLLLIFCSVNLLPQEFDDWFTDGAMRVDLVFTGTDTESTYALEAVRKEKYYSGSRSSLADPFDYGDHMFEIRDAGTGTLIYSYTYCTLFREWQTTLEAQLTRRAFSHVLRFPWPKNAVEVRILDRDKKGVFRESWKATLDPESIFVDPTPAKEFEVVELQNNGPAENRVDILFLAEGYTEGEMEKFLEDARRSMEYIFSEEPFTGLREAFNVRAVLSYGPDSGTDIPGKGIWKRTVMNSSFYTFGIERYMTTPDFRAVCDVASNAPCDQAYILVNTDKYGGGGIYNFYSISAADNEQSRAVVIHEFGHAFAGLADEYYTSEVAYNDFFPLDVEPWNPNLTTRVDFAAKWEDMIGRKVPVPTPPHPEYEATVGVYEGGGYVAKGVYRPMIDCRMHTNDAAFCPVCSRAIKAMVARYTGQ